MIDFSDWPPWTYSLGWTVATLVAAWAAGMIVGRVVSARISRWLARRHQPVADSLAVLVRTRTPWWFLLAGLWLSAPYWPLSPQALGLVQRLLFAVVAGSVTFATAALAVRLIDSYGALIAPALPVTGLTRNLAWTLVTVLGLLVILNGVGVSITPMLTALGIGGLAVALALQEPLANFFAGLFLTLAGQIRIGDYVRLDSGQEGYVVDFSWRSTRLRMLANNLVVVPNAKLAQAVVINHHLPSPDLAVLVEVGVDYASNLEHVERVVADVGRQVMTQVAGGVEDFQPFVRYHTFGDSSVNFTVILRAREFVDQYLIKHEFIKRLHTRFDHEHISIPFPIRTLTRRGPADAATRR